MNPLALTLIEEVWTRQCEMEEEETQALVARFLEEQPYVAAYLLAADENMGEESDESQLIPLATMVWELFTENTGLPCFIEGEDLDEAEDRNIKLLESANDASETGMIVLAERLFSEYNQRSLLQFGLEVLMRDHEDEPDDAPNRLGLELLYLKTVIDCFDEALD